MHIKKIDNRNNIYKYIESLKNPIIAEIGSRTGDFFNSLLTPNCSQAFIIDIWQDTGNISENDNGYSQEELDAQYEYVCNRFSSDPRVRIIRDFSINASRLFEDNFFDFIYIDADHSESGCFNDLVSWFPKIKPGGILSGHDYISGELTKRLGHKLEFGVIEAVTKFLQINSDKIADFHKTAEVYSSYFIVKNE